jgi:hypothetical protein
LNLFLPAQSEDIPGVDPMGKAANFPQSIRRFSHIASLGYR